MSELMAAKSYSEMVELSSAYMRKQFDAMIAQAKELSEHAQKGGYRNCRADQGKHQQHLQQGGLTRSQ